MTRPVIQKILVPVDYSPTAKRAAQMAASLAKELGAELFLFHSFGLPVVGIAESIVIADDIKHNEGKKLNRYLTELKSEYADVKIHGILEFGTAVDWIQRTVDDKKIDLIVMGTKGNTDSANAVLGSVASHVINTVKCPVLVIPKGHRSYNISEVVFASDFHFTNNVASYLSPLLTLVDVFQPYVHLVHFNAQRPSGSHIKNIEELKLTGLLKDSKHTFHYVEAVNTEEALFEFAEKHHCDLLVAVTRHYSMWERIFHRSLTKKLVLHSEIPVLILHEY